MQFKRKRVSSKRAYPARARSAARKGRTGYANVMRASTLANRVQRLEGTIETKEGAQRIANIQVAHNNVYIWNTNPFETAQGIQDPMDVNLPQRIGDKVTLKGMNTTFFVEGSLGRSKVYFRIMLLKGPRGAPFTRADIFKGSSTNKMIDQLNTEKYKIITQRVFNVTPPNAVAASLTVLTGVPATGTVAGITGNKIVRFWIPGSKIAKNGSLQYENGSGNLKFYDYRWVVLAYDWYGTPQDTNNVGFINEAYTKMYFKDA